MEFKVGDKVLYGTEKYIVTDVAYYTYGLTDDRGCVTWAIKEDLKLVKPTIDDLRDYMLEHFVDAFGNLDIDGLDFSDFEGDIFIGQMNVLGDLTQNYNVVKGSLYQSGHEVGGSLFQSKHKVELDYICESIEYGGTSITDEPKKLLKAITKEELTELGYYLDE